MYAKAIVLIVCLTALAATMLQLRQRRFEAMHEMATLHQQMNQHRQDLWLWQSRIADATDPNELRDAVARAGLELEPLIAQPRPTAVAQGPNEPLRRYH